MPETATLPRAATYLRRQHVLRLIPDDVPLTATGLGQHIGVSRATAWRMFFATHRSPLNGTTIAAVQQAFPDREWSDLFEVA